MYSGLGTYYLHNSTSKRGVCESNRKKGPTRPGLPYLLAYFESFPRTMIAFQTFLSCMVVLMPAFSSPGYCLSLDEFS